jgi:regulator of replication initiation timing
LILNTKISELDNALSQSKEQLSKLNNELNESKKSKDAVVAENNMLKSTTSRMLSQPKNTILENQYSNSLIGLNRQFEKRIELLRRFYQHFKFVDEK